MKGHQAQLLRGAHKAELRRIIGKTRERRAFQVEGTAGCRDMRPWHCMMGSNLGEGPEFDFTLGAMRKTLACFWSGYVWYTRRPAEESDRSEPCFTKATCCLPSLPHFNSCSGLLRGSSVSFLSLECDPLEMSCLCSNFSIVPHGTQREPLTCFKPVTAARTATPSTHNKDSLLPF